MSSKLGPTTYKTYSGNTRITRYRPPRKRRNLPDLVKRLQLAWHVKRHMPICHKLRHLGTCKALERWFTRIIKTITHTRTNLEGDLNGLCHGIVRDTSPPKLGSGYLCTAALGPGVNAALTWNSLLARCTNVLARSGTFWFRTPIFVLRSSSPRFLFGSRWCAIS